MFTKIAFGALYLGKQKTTTYNTEKFFFCGCNVALKKENTFFVINVPTPFLLFKQLNRKSSRVTTIHKNSIKKQDLPKAFFISNKTNRNSKKNDLFLEFVGDTGVHTEQNITVVIKYHYPT